MSLSGHIAAFPGGSALLQLTLLLLPTAPHSPPGAWEASVSGAPASPQPREVPGPWSSFSRNGAPTLSRAPAAQPRPQGTGLSSSSGKEIP